jgi:hypothetical protein
VELCFVDNRKPHPSTTHQITTCGAHLWLRIGRRRGSVTLAAGWRNPVHWLRIGRRRGSVTLAHQSAIRSTGLRIGRRRGSVTLSRPLTCGRALLRIGRRRGSVTLPPSLSPITGTPCTQFDG